MIRPPPADYSTGYTAARSHACGMDDARVLAAIGRWLVHRSRYKRVKQFEFASGLIDGYSDVIIARMGNVQWGVRA